MVSKLMMFGSICFFISCSTKVIERADLLGICKKCLPCIPNDSIVNVDAEGQQLNILTCENNEFGFVLTLGDIGPKDEELELWLDNVCMSYIVNPEDKLLYKKKFIGKQSRVDYNIFSSVERKVIVGRASIIENCILLNNLTVDAVLIDSLNGDIIRYFKCFDQALKM